MADYTTVESVKKYFNGLETTDTDGNVTNISEADIESFITEQSMVIDFRIGKKYELPITNDDDKTYLQVIADKLVVCIIDKILRAYSTDDETQFVRRRNYCKEAEEMLQGILNDKIILNSNQKSYQPIKYNSTSVYCDSDCGCRQIEKCDYDCCDSDCDYDCDSSSNNCSC